MDFWMITFRIFEGPSASCGESQFCSKNTPVGIDVPTTAGGWNLAYGLFSVGETEGVQGGTEGNISPVGCPPKAEMTRSSGKQQAERTAVRAAPIVCPEESPLVRPQAHISCRGGLTRRLRRGRWGCRPEGVQYFLSKRKKVPKKASGTATPEAARPAARYSQISAFRALPCPALVFAQACQSLTAYGSCAHWAHAPSRPKLRSAGAERLDAPNLFGASNSGR